MLEAVTNSMMPLPFRIVDKCACRHDSTMLTVKPDDKKSRCTFKPGQFYMVYAFGHGEVPISVSGDPANTEHLTFTIKNVGSVTAALCALETGDMLGLRGPFGTAWPMDVAKGHDVIIVAGGLGLVPLRPAIYQILSRRAQYGKVSLLYGARAPETILFSNELEDWQKHIHVAVTVDSAASGWCGHVGLVTELIKNLEVKAEKSIAMACGPENMMRFSATALLKRGLKSPQIHLLMERNMKCAIGHCGRCQYGPYFLCKDGAVFSFDQVERLLGIGEI